MSDGPVTYGERNSQVAAAIASEFEKASRPDMTFRNWEQFMHDAARAAIEAADATAPGA